MEQLSPEDFRRIIDGRALLGQSVDPLPEEWPDRPTNGSRDIRHGDGGGHLSAVGSGWSGRRCAGTLGFGSGGGPIAVPGAGKHVGLSGVVAIIVLAWTAFALAQAIRTGGAIAWTFAGLFVVVSRIAVARARRGIGDRRSNE
jgi:hypothetical protein